jgi:putative transposase
MRERLDLIDREHTLSARKQCEILAVHRSSLYYNPQGEKEDNLEIMRIMDEHYLKYPTEGVIRMQDLLLTLGVVVNHKRVRRLLRLMGLMAIYPKRNLSKLGLSKYIRPYLLKGLTEKARQSDHIWPD